MRMRSTAAGRTTNIKQQRHCWRKHKTVCIIAHMPLHIPVAITALPMRLSPKAWSNTHWQEPHGPPAAAAAATVQSSIP
jgi:hypothetical protein